jgi:hypothetical protein
MSNRSFDRAVRNWLEDGEDRTSPAAVDAVLLAIRTTPQERNQWIPRRFSRMPAAAQLAAAVAIVAIGVVGILAFLNRGPGVGNVPTAPPSPSPAATRAGVVLPPARSISPTAVIDLATLDAIPISTDGEEVWIGVEGAVVRVDGRTNAQTRINVADMATGNGGLQIASDGLWIADYRASRIERVDPVTGAVQLQSSVSSPLAFLLLGDGLWVSSQGSQGIYPIDRSTGNLGPKIGTTYEMTVGLGDFWEARPRDNAADALTRLDPAGKSTGTVTVPAGSACAVEGSFPDNVWAGCNVFAGARSPMTVVRVDPVTNTVAARVTLPQFAGLAGVVDGLPWFFVLQRDSGQDRTTLVAADPETGELIGALDLGALSPNLPVMTSQALWIPDEQGKRVLRYDLTDVHP